MRNPPIVPSEIVSNLSNITLVYRFKSNWGKYTASTEIFPKLKWNGLTEIIFSDSRNRQEMLNQLCIWGMAKSLPYRHNFQFVRNYIVLTTENISINDSKLYKKEAVERQKMINYSEKHLPINSLILRLNLMLCCHGCGTVWLKYVLNSP